MRLCLFCSLLVLASACYPTVPHSVGDDDSSPSGPSISFEFANKSWGLDNVASSTWYDDNGDTFTDHWEGTFPVTSGDAWGTLTIGLFGLTLPWSGGTITDGTYSGLTPYAEMNFQLTENYWTLDGGILSCNFGRSITVNTTTPDTSTPISGAFTGGFSGNVTGTCDEITNGFFSNLSF